VSKFYDVTTLPRCNTAELRDMKEGQIRAFLLDPAIVNQQSGLHVAARRGGGRFKITTHKQLKNVGRFKDNFELVFTEWLEVECLKEMTPPAKRGRKPKQEL